MTRRALLTAPPWPTVVDAYKQAAAVMRLPAVLKLSLILLTRAVAFSAAETLTTLKLLERGVPKQHMAMLSAFMTPVSVFLPVYISKWTGGARPLDCVTGEATDCLPIVCLPVPVTPSPDDAPPLTVWP